MSALVRQPRVPVAVIATLAVALAAALSALAVVDGVILRPLPLPDGDRIVTVWNVGPRLPAGVRAISFQDLDDWRAASRSLDALSGYTAASYTLSGRGDARRLAGMRVARDFDRVLGVHAALGRLFLPDDFTAAGSTVVVLTHAFWTREFGASAAAVGTDLMLDGTPRRIVGVLPPMALQFPSSAHEVWTPLVPRAGAPWESSRATGWLEAVGRLRPGVAIDDAREELSAIARSLAAAYPASNRDRTGMDVRPLRDVMIAGARPALLLIAGAVGALLLAGYVNAVQLLVGHAAVRRREFAIRHALGATPARVARQVTIEAALVSFAATAAAIALAPALVSAFTALAGEALPRQGEIDAMRTAMRWGGAFWALTCAVIASPLLLLIVRAQAVEVSSTRVAGRRGDTRLRAALIAAQASMSIVLIAGSVLFVRTLAAFHSVSLGFSPSVLTMEVTPSRTYAPSAPQTMGFYRDVLDAVRAMPGVDAAASSTSIPFVVSGWSYSIGERGRPENRRLVNVTIASPGYFDTLQAAMIAGRALTDDEHRSSEDSVVISRTLARQVFGSEALAVGRAMEYSGHAWQIVGVVADLRRTRLAEGEVAELYLPWHLAGQRPQAIAVRGAAIDVDRAPAIAAAARRMDSGATIAEIAMLSDRVQKVLAPQRLRATLLTALAIVAALLTAVGIYSVTAFAVTMRVREQAIRMALGETAGGARRRVIAGALAPSLAGIAIGLGLAWFGARFVEGFLFDVRARDPLALAFVGVSIVVLTIGAAWLPAARAARLDPAALLKDA